MLQQNEGYRISYQSITEIDLGSPEELLKQRQQRLQLEYGNKYCIATYHVSI